MPSARDAAEGGRRAGRSALRWAGRTLLAIGIVLGAMAGFVVALFALVLGAGATVLLYAPMIGAGIGFLAVRLGLAHGHRLAPVALWMAERRAKGGATGVIVLMVARSLLGRDRR